MRRKVTVVGAGNVGATAAQEIARRDYADVVLVDIKEGLPQGKALDIDQAAPVLGYEPSVVGTNGYEETEGSDVVVVTAGVPRTGDMSRDDLVTTNEGIVGSVTRLRLDRLPVGDGRSRFKRRLHLLQRRAPVSLHLLDLFAVLELRVLK